MDGAGYRRTAWIEVAELTYNNGSEKEEQDLDWGSADQSTTGQTNKAAMQEMVGPLHNFHASADCGVAQPPSISDNDPEGSSIKYRHSDPPCI